jgi:hypothetical protein
MVVATDQITFSKPGDADCRPPSSEIGPSEVEGYGLWALVFAPLPIKAGSDTKIVWRIGGHGPFHIAGMTTDGTGARLTFGPESHGSSSWYIAETEEWGTGMVFPKAGCWRVHATRTDTSGDVYFLIVR